MQHTEGVIVVGAVPPNALLPLGPWDAQGQTSGCENPFRQNPVEEGSQLLELSDTYVQVLSDVLTPRKKTKRGGLHRGYKLKQLEIKPLCTYCRCPLDRKTATLDHVKARSRGGQSSISNLVLSCGPCNTAKASKSLASFRRSHYYLWVRGMRNDPPPKRKKTVPPSRRKYYLQRRTYRANRTMFDHPYLC
jgi:hypothetical protein